MSYKLLETMFDLENFGGYALNDLLDLSFSAIGLAVFAILLIKAVQNYNTHRSYFVGAIVILCIYTIFFMAMNATDLKSNRVDSIETAKMFFTFFGIIMSIALVFYFLMSCVRMLIERTP